MLYIFTLKTCSSCKEIKPKTDFGSHKRTKDGLRYSCRSCESKKAGEWAKANPDRKRKTVRECQRRRRARLK